jgi:hypothetical protein
LEAGRRGAGRRGAARRGASGTAAGACSAGERSSQRAAAQLALGTGSRTANCMLPALPMASAQKPHWKHALCQRRLSAVM